MKYIFSRILIVLLVLFLGLILFLAGFREIRDGYMGVETAKIGKYRVLPDPLPSGWYWRRPLLVDIHTYPVDEQTISIQLAEIPTQEKKHITVSAVLYYQLDPKKLVELHQQFGAEYQIRSKLDTFFRAFGQQTISQYSREEIFSQQKEEFIQKWRTQLEDKFAGEGIQIKDLGLTSLHFPDQYTQQIQSNYPSELTPVEFSHQTRTKDKQSCVLHLLAYYRISPQDAEKVHQQVGIGFVENIIIPQAKSLVDSLSTSYTIDEIYQQESRKKFVSQLQQQLREQMQDYLIQIAKLQLKSIDFSKEYLNFLSKAQQTEQQIQQLELERKLFEQKARNMKLEQQAEMERKILQAEEKSKATLIEAKAFQEAELMKAEGKAKALERVQQVISANPNLLKYLYIDRLSENVKVIVAPTGADGLPLTEVMKASNEEGSK